MKAIIYSSCDGSRLRPVTCSIPHNLLPLMGTPLIEHTVRALHRQNINDITILSAYLHEEVAGHFEKAGINVTCLDLCNFDTFLKEDDVLFISDSIVTDLDFNILAELRSRSGCDGVFVTKHISTDMDYGVVNVAKDGFISAYNENPCFSLFSGIPFTGIAVIRKTDKLSDCNNIRNLALKLAGKSFLIYAYTPDCYIENITDFSSYHKCCRDFMDKKIKLPVLCPEKAPSVWIDETASVMQGVIISPPAYIGKDSVINKGARIGAYSQICSNTTIDCYADIKRSTIMNNTYIGESASLRGTFIGSKCRIGLESAAYERSVIGAGTKIGKRSVIRTSVHIWPDKIIDDERCISENIMWENNIGKRNFCDGVFEGIINSEITPETATHLGRAFVSLAGKKIAVSCEGESSGTMIKNALIAGIQSGGGIAYDMGEQPLPITRSAVRFYSLDGAIALTTHSRGISVYGAIDVINSSGANLEQKDIHRLERLMDNPPETLINASQIPEPEFLFEYKLYYLKQLINSTSKKSLGAKVLIHCPSVWAVELLKSAATDLDCNFVFTEISDPDLFAEKIKEDDFDLGALCDLKCETLTIVTGSGYILTEFDYCAVTSLIIMKTFPRACIYIPESAPDSIEILAEKYNAEVLRTKISPPHIMNELSRKDMKQYLHQFIYRFDAVGAIIILLDYLFTTNQTIGNLLSEIPPIGTVCATVSCSSDEQSEIVNRLYLRYHIPATSTDCVKINFENGWVLVVPKKEKSLIQVISHSTSKEYAQELADICLDEIAGR